MNLLGTVEYDPSLPWVSKVRNDDERIAADLFTFVDDLRPTGGSKKDVWRAARKAASTLNHLGIQDAARKRRDSSQSPGAWAGAVIRTGVMGVLILTSEEKWMKAKGMLAEVRAMLGRDPLAMSRKRLEQIRGFLMDVSRTCTSMTPYMIGFHMTIDSWRRGRDKDGWRTNDEAEWVAIEKEEREESGEGPEPDHCWRSEGPLLVKAVPRFDSDVKALEGLTATDMPPLRRVRCNKTGHAFYGFGDASGPAFGATIQIGDHVHYEYGQWVTEVTEERSSNWREVGNLAEFLEGAVRDHNLKDCEIFIFTDNTTAEVAFWKGSSKSRRLFELVLRLRKLELRHNLILHVVHVSGRRMIAEGTDGLSRGDHSEGVMQGQRMEDFIPLDLDPLTRSPGLKKWLKDMMDP
jgi:hypothetical protein